MFRVRPTPLLCAGVVLLLGMSGCRRQEEPPPAETAPAPAPAPATPSLSDPQIAHIVVTANAIDSTFGELALTKAQSQAVKDFARTMIADHGTVNKQAVVLAVRLSVTPEDNEVSRQLLAAADQARAGMTNLSGAAFDSAYIAREVQYH
ncbi:MAG: DUF4142 domain-containing protein, partial [Longimicrobiales bacterium]